MTAASAGTPPADGRAIGDAWRIEPLFDASSGGGRRRGGALPPDLARRYGADLSIALRPDRPTIVSNFVSTIDGVVAFDTQGRTGGRQVSGSSEPDHFLMGLVRATADAVLNGAGTVRSGKHRWTPSALHPASAAAYADWRQTLGLPAQPTAIIVTASGSIDPDHPGLHDPGVPVVIVSTDVGAGRLRRLGLPTGVEVVAAGTGERVDPAALVEVFRDRDLELVVCEGGPTLFGGMLEARLIDELFLTIAPQFAGRSDDAARLSLVEGVGFAIGDTPWARLESVMRADSHLFLRYRLDGSPRGVGEKS